MKFRFTILTLILLLSTFFVGAQNIDKISTRCTAPNNSLFASVLVNRSGDIVYTPCPTRESIFNGIVDLSGATVIGAVTGSGTATFFPLWTGASALGDSNFSQNGSSYFMDNATNNATFAFGFNASNAGSGSFAIGGQSGLPASAVTYQVSEATQVHQWYTANANTYMILDGASDTFDVATGNTGFARIQSLTTSIGDFNFNGNNGTNLQIDDNAATFEFQVQSGINNAAFDLTDIFLYQYRKTNTGTIGNVTINAPAGRVNIGAATDGLTVTNSTVTTDSLIIVTPQAVDATCAALAGIPALGSFQIRTMDGATCTGNLPVAFFVIN